MSRYCSKCGKAKVACICRYISTINTDIELVILQHKTETQRPLGTAKILTLSLPNSRTIVGEDFSKNNELNALLADNSFQHWVLYPNEGSELISPQLSETIPNKPLRLIVIDATWKKAYKIWKLSQNLHPLQAVHLPDDLLGNYRVRKSPSDNSLSTVEAAGHAMMILDSANNYQSLFTAFEQMIDDHISAMPPGVYQRNYLS